MCPKFTVLLMAWSFQIAGASGPQTTKPSAGDEAALAAMKVSAACADAAGRLYREGGYEDRKQNSKDGTRFVDYVSHYNYELKRCLIKVQTTTMVETRTITEEMVVDAIERKQIGLLVRIGEKLILTRGDASSGKMIDATPSNLAWFTSLMEK